MSWCEKCDERKAVETIRISSGEMLVCDVCLDEYVECIKCHDMVLEEQAYPVYDGREYGYGYRGLDGVVCENCHGLC